MNRARFYAFRLCGYSSCRRQPLQCTHISTHIALMLRRRRGTRYLERALQCHRGSTHSTIDHLSFPIPRILQPASKCLGIRLDKTKRKTWFESQPIYNLTSSQIFFLLENVPFPFTLNCARPARLRANSVATRYEHNVILITDNVIISSELPRTVGNTLAR